MGARERRGDAGAQARARSEPRHVAGVRRQEAGARAARGGTQARQPLLRRARRARAQVALPRLDAWTLDKICATGFNRSFCGKNATMFGKGVYFARDSGYSTHTTYSRPDENGVQRMLLCRVLLASYTLGIKDAIVPLERDGGILFDSTVNNLADPSIFVVYH